MVFHPDRCVFVFLAGLLVACGASAPEEETAAPSQNDPLTVGDVTTGQPESALEDGDDDPYVRDTPSEALDRVHTQYRLGESEFLPVRSVVLRKNSTPPHQLVFFDEDVDCAAVRGSPLDHEAFIAMTDVPASEGALPAVGPVAEEEWTYRVGDRGPETKMGAHGWVHITRIPTDESVEGTVAVETTLDEKPFVLDGAFVAVTCELEG